MAQRKPYNPPKFIAVGRPHYIGDFPAVAAVGTGQNTVVKEAIAYQKRNHRDETTYVYQLVAVAKPKPIEFDIETFAVCKDPKSK